MKAKCTAAVQLFLCLVILGVTGCGYEEDMEPAPAPVVAVESSPKPTSPPSPVPPPPPENSAPVEAYQEPRFQALLKTFPEPNHYAVEVVWSEGTGVRPRVFQRSGGNSINVIQPSDYPDGRYLDEKVIPGTTYKYLLHLEPKKEGAGPVLLMQTVSVPKDLVVHKAEDFKGEGFSRLFLAKNSVIRMNGNYLRLNMLEIISDDATIETIGESKAPAGKSARRSGDIMLWARRARGRLKILARGENGGDGLDGVNGAPGAPGAKGRDGDFDTNPELLKHLQPWVVRGHKQWALGVTRDPNHSEWKRSLGPIPYYVCTVQTGDGAPGEPGRPGGDGGDGGNGGDAPRVYVEIDEPSSFDVSIIQEPGIGGLGGRPGKGGAGGSGGAPGEPDIARKCAPAKAGVSGQPGQDGRQGRPGSQGNKLPTCVKLGSKETGDCSKFNFREN